MSIAEETVKNHLGSDLGHSLFFKEHIMVRSFKARVRNVLISSANEYKDNFANKLYLIFAKEFKFSKYYTVLAKEDNFLHLTGVATNLKPLDFYNKCISGNLLESDFDIGNKQRKGSNRRKINVLNDAMNMFVSGKKIVVEEKFVKNKVVCSFATSDNTCMLGFVLENNAKPKTLLKGNELKNIIDVELIVELDNYSDEVKRVVYNPSKYSEDEIIDIILDRS